MKRMLSLVAAAGLALALPLTDAEAQRPSFGLFAGATMPTGDTGDNLKTGFNFGATLGFTPVMLPVGLRIDGAWNSLDFEDPAAGGDPMRILSATVNAQLSIPMGAVPTISPYLIGGLGLYNLDAEFLGEESQNEFGWNVGAGLRFALAGFSTFAEIRYTGISTEGDPINIIPISFGIMF